jgi:hypothetical protein
MLMMRFYQLQRWSCHVAKASFGRSAKFRYQSAADPGFRHRIPLPADLLKSYSRD